MGFDWKNLGTLVLAWGLAGMSGSSMEASGPDEQDPASVVVVANAAVDGSRQVARAYMKARAIPKENFIVLKGLPEARLSHQAYVESIHNPLIGELLDRGLVEGIEGPLDAYGRRNVAVLAKKIKYIVLCYGMPYIVNGDPVPEEHDLAFRKRHFTGRSAGLARSLAEGQMARTNASVDGELALLLKRESPVRGFYPNPLYKNKWPGTLGDILRVTRLDGPSPAAVVTLIGNTLEGEQTGLKGRAYVDEDGRGGGFAVGNEWMQRCAALFAQLGFDLGHDRNRSTFPADARFDAPVLYAGWYAWNVDGPFRLPGFRFPPGAVAAHLHSFSAADLRSTEKGWVGPLVERGVSATFGNVSEPFLGLTHNFDLFFAALAEGWCFGDAAYFALPGLSWQGVAVGDPLYRPFALPLGKQGQAIGDPRHILDDQYVVIRQTNLLVRGGELEEARQLAARGMREVPGPALALHRARLLAAEGNIGEAVQAVSFMADLTPMDPLDWGLFADIADSLREWKEPAAALKIYQKLEKQRMPEQVQLAFLKRGIQAAQDAGRPDIAIDWQARVTPPPPPAPAETDPAVTESPNPSK